MAEKYKQYILDFRLHDGTTHSVPFNVPIGDPGVHFGSDHPPDTATVWVDPNGEPTSTEDWDFTLYGGTTETKRVVVVGAEEENGHSGILRLKDANGVWREIPALVGPRGFRGEKGVPGVYVGSDAPPEDAMVWVNPDGEPTSTEDWEFAMEDGSRDTKRVVVVGAEESNGYSGILMVRQEDGSWKEIPAIAGSKVNTDTTLTKSGVPADAKTTGDKLVELSDDIPEVVVKTIKKVETAPGSNETVTRNGFSVEVMKTKSDGSVSMSGGTVFDGVSPHIGANGNWFIGAVDTGVPARGQDGTDYVLPVGGDKLGGVKNGGNVVINDDGTMTAPNEGKADFVVQDTAPEDTSVLWVDTTDDSDDGFAGISVAGAKVGQTVKIASVDENGVPTAWEAVEFPKEEKFELIKTVEFTEVATLILDNLNLKRILVYFTVPAETTFDDGAYRYFNTLFYRGNTRRVVYTTIEDKAAIRRGFVEAEVIGKQVKTTTVASVASISHATIQYTPDAANYSVDSDADVFTKIYINSKIPKGTKIDVYGVRA